jgi:hypothetical protein
MYIGGKHKRIGMIRTFYYGLSLLVLLTAKICSALAGGGIELIEPADKQAIRLLLSEYADIFTSLYLEERNSSSNFAVLFSMDTVRLENDFDFYGSAFDRPSAYHEGVKDFFFNNPLISNPSIVLSRSKDYVYERMGADYFVTLHKSIAYRYGRMGKQVFASWERLQIMRVGREFRIVGIRKVSGPGEMDMTVKATVTMARPMAPVRQRQVYYPQRPVYAAPRQIYSPSQRVVVVHVRRVYYVPPAGVAGRPVVYGVWGRRRGW